jgi:hypothetical protein
MRKISFILTNSGTINAVANGKAYTIPRDHQNYEGIKEAVVKDDPDALDRLANVSKTVTEFAKGHVKVKDGVVYYGDEPVHNSLTSRILTMMRDGFPFDAMLKFLENLMENPSYRAVQELYTFLEHRGLPITEDGCFLGYKAVRADWTDKHSGKYDNKVGTVNSVPRRTVDDNWRNECSSGFHVGCLEYVKGFTNYDSDHVVIVKVNPADVVSVPPNEVTKLRTCKYEVVSEYDKNLLRSGVHLPEAVHTASGTVATPGVQGMGGYGYRSEEEDPSVLKQSLKEIEDEDEDDDSDLDDEDEDDLDLEDEEDDLDDEDEDDLDDEDEEYDE